MSTSGIRNAAACAVWAYAVWILLTWTATAEQLIFGAVVAAIVGCALAPLGAVAAPWRAFAPKRLFAWLRLLVGSAGRIVVANFALARRIWGPRSRLRTGMIVVPTQARSDGAVAAVGLVSSLIVDNQLVDLDRSAAQLQYHAVDVPSDDVSERYERIIGPTERLVREIAGER
jgi:multicomponent Na+:H+ antiporter subunit E